MQNELADDSWRLTERLLIFILSKARVKTPTISRQLPSANIASMRLHLQA
jgi:hypothetical protein